MTFMFAQQAVIKTKERQKHLCLVVIVYSPTRRSSGTRPEAGEPLNFTLGTNYEIYRFFYFSCFDVNFGNDEC